MPIYFASVRSRRQALLRVTNEWPLGCQCQVKPDFLLGGRTSASGEQTLVREVSPLVKRRNSAARFSRLTNGCALECGVGFRLLRTCRRTRPGQLCANSRASRIRKLLFGFLGYAKRWPTEFWSSIRQIR